MSNRLRRLRERSGLSLRDAATAIGITFPHLWGIEAGKHDNPTLATLRSMARVYRTKVRLIIGERP